MVSMKMPYPRVGSFTSTCVTTIMPTHTASYIVFPHTEQHTTSGSSPGERAGTTKDTPVAVCLLLCGLLGRIFSTFSKIRRRNDRGLRESPAEWVSWRKREMPPTGDDNLLAGPHRLQEHFDAVAIRLLDNVRC